ncbi:hypothetical protein L210DRAFT_3643377 [Boletus edulis BED1]|uniref:Uncharacterized protein n=1 Tax=Boletus edulis BED1 TaxID=1328754 RepID=A0AAD4BZ33_BOLED|nr:hypothetical protein L210DRAFT_3643377 [Boletus edulis BED1]
MAVLQRAEQILPDNSTLLTSCRRQEHVQSTAAEEQRRLCAEAERQAERDRLEREQDALRAQQLAEYQALSFQADGPDLSENVERRPSGLPSRNRHLPQRYRDDPPPLPIPVPAPPIADSVEDHDLPTVPSDIEMDTTETAISQELPTNTTPHL